MPGPLPPDFARRLTWVAEGVALLEPPAGSPGAASILIDDGDVVLVDAGLPLRELEVLAPFVDVLLLTHVHAPHVLGAHLFPTVWAPRAEARGLRSLHDYLDVAGVERSDRPLVGEALLKAGYVPAEVRKSFRAGGILKLARYEWHLVSAPGHSPGLTLLHEPERHILVAVDLDGSDHGLWYGYPSSDLADLERTAGAIAEMDVALLLTSHEPPRKRGIRALFRGVATRIQERDRSVLSVLSEPRSIDEIVARAPIQGTTASPIARYFERVMVEKHLARLMERDYAAARQDGRYERLA